MLGDIKPEVWSVLVPGMRIKQGDQCAPEIEIVDRALLISHIYVE
jgi:hypothetical protein